jgi:hypothetical protein
MGKMSYQRYFDLLASDIKTIISHNSPIVFLALVLLAPAGLDGRWKQ